MAKKFTGYKENPLFESLTASAYSLGKTLPKRPARRAIDMSRFQNIPGAVKEAGVAPTGATVPTAGAERFKELGTISTPYMGRTRYEARHPGIDVAAPTGTPVSAYAGGTVTGMRTGQARTTAPSFGNYVVIQDAQGNYHRYSHLSENWVQVGQRVQPGTQIGAVGQSGSVYSTTPGGSGAHLDYRIFSAAKQYFNPLTYL